MLSSANSPLEIMVFLASPPLSYSACYRLARSSPGNRILPTVRPGLPHASSGPLGWKAAEGRSEGRAAGGLNNV